jgi:uncharacterized coiled-coil protein SlyX
MKDVLFNCMLKLRRQLEMQISLNQNLIKEHNKKYAQLKNEFDLLHEKYIDLIKKRKWGNT